MNKLIKTISNKHLFLPIMFAALFALPVFGSHGYRIEVRISGLQDTLSYLAYHFGDRQFLKDTARVDPFGQFLFKGDEKLDQGMYMIVLPGNIYFEVIIGDNQNFSITTHKDHMIDSLRFYQSDENVAFYEYLALLRKNNQEIATMRERVGVQNLTEQESESINRRIRELEQEIKAAQQRYIQAFPEGVFSMILRTQQSPDISEAKALDPDDPNRRDLEYQLYKQRFWDHVDLSDDRILRTPVYHAMLNRFFNHFLLQIPDTIIKEADALIERSRANKEMFRYTLWFVANNAERSNIMGMDAVFVHLVETYYNTGQAFWMTEEGLSRMKKRASQIKPGLIGNIAPNIVATTPDGTTKALHDIEAEFLLIYFWESECGHCKRETPELIRVFQKHKEDGLQVFALNVEADREKWIDAISSYDVNWINVNDMHNRSGFRDNYDVFAIPLIYLLDRDKKIIAKKISAEQVSNFIQFHLNRKAATPTD